MKAKPVLLLMTPRCLVGVTSVRKVTEAGPPTPMARPRQILSRLPWGQQRTHWMRRDYGDWEDSEDPEDVIYCNMMLHHGCIMMYDMMYDMM